MRKNLHIQMDYERILYLLIIVISVESGHWSYTGETGPLYWHELFPYQCSGKHQSPINIYPEETIYNPNLKNFAIWYDPPKPDFKMQLINNGHTVQVNMEGDIFISNGGLNNVFKALQFHFHWGHKAHHGSEHLIDNRPSPIEMHLVTYNYDMYADVGQALTKKGGLAVFGVLYELSEDDNPSLEPVVKNLKNICNPETQTRTELPVMSVTDFLPPDLSRYYRYNGSLTTPGCFESVIWTVFETKQTISLRQLQEFTTVVQYKKHRADMHGRHRHHRDIRSQDERTKTRLAKHVLDELEIRGNKIEEDKLRFDLTQHKTMEDMPQSEAIISVSERSSNSARIPQLDEQGAAQIDKFIDYHTEEGDNTIFNRESNRSNSASQVSLVTHNSHQESIVNNFRPVQPLNNRIVYRSFKLGYTPTQPIGQQEKSNVIEVYTDWEYDNSYNGARSHQVSTAVICIVFLCALFFIQMINNISNVTL